METTLLPATIESTPTISSFSDSISFEHAQRVAKMLASSSLIPTAYQGRIDNCLVALEMANRSNSSPLMVMQNLHIIQGKPSWSSPYIIASINSSGRFKTKLDFTKGGEGDEYGCEAYAIGFDGEKKVGPKVTWAMVKAEGWLNKPGSKWKTMPELMFMYRAAAFFGRLYAPEILMGMHTVEEATDTHEPQTLKAVVQNKEDERVTNFIQNSKTVDELKQVEGVRLTDPQIELFNQKFEELNGK
jgi:hypothetical protein